MPRRRPRLRLAISFAISLLALCACLPVTPPRSAATRAPTQPASPAPSPKPATSASPSNGIGSVFVIVMENRSYQEALGGAYTAALARRFALATNYHAVAHPSLPNYLALTGGTTAGIRDDGFHQLATAGLGGELTQAHVSWAAYMESMTRGCHDSPPPYALKHNPFAYYQGGCSANVRPLDDLASDLGGASPHRFVWISPNLCHDGHDCSTATADAFLSRLVPEILASSAWQRDGVLFITWDESDSATDNRVPCLVVAPHLLAHLSARYYTHYSLLATVSTELGVAAPGLSAQSVPFGDLLPLTPMGSQ